VNAFNAVWSTNGEELAFAEVSGEIAVYEISSGTERLLSVGPATDPERPVTTQLALPVWSANDTHLLVRWPWAFGP
jgi:Tol biopolymer transport system component